MKAPQRVSLEVVESKGFDRTTKHDAFGDVNTESMEAEVLSMLMTERKHSDTEGSDGFALKKDQGVFGGGFGGLNKSTTPQLMEIMTKEYGDINMLENVLNDGAAKLTDWALKVGLLFLLHEADGLKTIKDRYHPTNQYIVVPPNFQLPFTFPKVGSFNNGRKNSKDQTTELIIRQRFGLADWGGHKRRNGDGGQIYVVCVENSVHWIVVVVKPKPKLVTVFDSQNPSTQWTMTTLNTKTNLCGMYNAFNRLREKQVKIMDMKVEQEEISQQAGENQCGDYVLFVVLSLVSGHHPEPIERLNATTESQVATLLALRKYIYERLRLSQGKHGETDELKPCETTINECFTGFTEGVQTNSNPFVETEAEEDLGEDDTSEVAEEGFVNPNEQKSDSCSSDEESESGASRTYDDVKPKGTRDTSNYGDTSDEDEVIGPVKADQEQEPTQVPKEPFEVEAGIAEATQDVVQAKSRPNTGQDQDPGSVPKDDGSLEDTGISNPSAK